jgi:hypothetical protein
VTQEPAGEAPQDREAERRRHLKELRRERKRRIRRYLTS